MIVFNNTVYIPGRHAVDRLLERLPEIPPQNAKSFIQYMAENGKVVIEVGKYRYIDYDGVILPCVKKGPKLYKVASILTKDLLEEYSLQDRINYYFGRCLYRRLV